MSGIAGCRCGIAGSGTGGMGAAAGTGGMGAAAGTGGMGAAAGTAGMGAAAGSGTGTAGTAGTALGLPLGRPGPVAGRPAGLCFKAPRLPTRPAADSTLTMMLECGPDVILVLALVLDLVLAILILLDINI